MTGTNRTGARAEPAPGSGDEVLDALAAVERAIEATVARNRSILDRIDHVKAERAAGRTYRQIGATEQQPGRVELVSANYEAIAEARSMLRRAQAQALHREGMTMDVIAALYGVSRQRVSALLRDAAG